MLLLIRCMSVVLLLMWVGGVLVMLRTKRLRQLMGREGLCWHWRLIHLILLGGKTSKGHQLYLNFTKLSVW